MSEPAVHGAHCFVVACHPTGAPVQWWLATHVCCRPGVFDDAASQRRKNHRSEPMGR